MEKLRFRMQSDSREELEKRIDEHVKRGAKQVSDITSIDYYRKHFKSIKYQKSVRRKFVSCTDVTKYVVYMEKERA